MGHRVGPLRLGRHRGREHDQRQGDEEERSLLEQEERAALAFAAPLQPEPIQEEKDDGKHRGDELGETREQEENEGQDVPGPRSPPLPRRGIAQVREKRRQEEEGAEKVLPVRDPGDRFGPQGMDGEEYRGDSHPQRHGRLPPCVPSLPRSPACLQKCQAQEEHPDGVRGMEKDVRQMVAARVHPPHRHVRGMAQHRGRNVGVVVEAGGEARDPLRVQRVERGIGVHVDVVIPVHEPMAQGRGEQGEGENGDEEGCEDSDSRGVDQLLPEESRAARTGGSRW